jgi:hypothetical protein
MAAAIQGMRTPIEAEAVAIIGATATPRGLCIQHHDRQTGPLQETSRREAGQAGTHDRHVGTNDGFLVGHACSTSERGRT